MISCHPCNYSDKPRGPHIVQCGRLDQAGSRGRDLSAMRRVPSLQSQGLVSGATGAGPDTIDAVHMRARAALPSHIN
jgi:hypothetical protein